MSDFLSGRFLGAADVIGDCDLVLLGLPFDATSSFMPGSRFAPQRIRAVSAVLETYSPYQGRDLTDVSFYDAGDLDLAPGEVEGVLRKIGATAAELVGLGRSLLAVGGEHLVSLPVIQAYHERYPDLQVIQLDAHADLRDNYEGERYSHATVMRRVAELVGFENVYQLGIRSGTREEFQFAEKGTRFHPFGIDEMASCLKIIGERPVYLTLDLDVLDPSVLPGTGTPEPGGIDFSSLLDALLQLGKVNLVGADVVELNPMNDTSNCSAVVAAKIIRELLMLIKT